MPVSLRDLVEKEFEGKVRAVENPKLTSLGTTAQLVLANNPNRVGFLIVNLSANLLYFSLENDVSSTKSLGIFKQGDGLRSVFKEDGDVTGWAIWGVASAASSAIYAVEFVTH